MRNNFAKAAIAALVSAAFMTAVAQTTPTSASQASGPRAAQAAKGDVRTGASNMRSNTTTGTAASGAETATVLVLMPTTMTADNQLGNGCWVRFYDDRNYRGANLTLVGPVDMPRMTVPGAVWRDWDSAVVGPKARVTTYDNENFRDRTATLAAGQHVADLNDNKLGWFEEIHSARVSCS